MVQYMKQRKTIPRDLPDFVKGELVRGPIVNAEAIVVRDLGNKRGVRGQLLRMVEVKILKLKGHYKQGDYVIWGFELEPSKGIG